MFLQFFYVSPEIENPSLILHQTLQTFYCNIVDLENIAMMLPPDLPIFTPLSSAVIGNPKLCYFQEVKAMNDAAKDRSLYMSHRQEILQRLVIRHARVEDCDDLVPLFKVHGEKMVQKFDDFNLSQLIENTEAIHKSFVAETHGKVVGFISLTTETNFDAVHQSYDITDFSDLKNGNQNRRSSFYH